MAKKKSNNDGALATNNKAKYNYALQLRKAGNYNDAITIFNELGDYSDAEAQIVETLNMKSADSGSSAN